MSCVDSTKDYGKYLRTSWYKFKEYFSFKFRTHNEKNDHVYEQSLRLYAGFERGNKENVIM